MSVVFALVLMMFIHCSCAIKCYVCSSRYGWHCDDPLDRDDDDVREVSCPANYNACWAGQGSYTNDRKKNNLNLLITSLINSNCLS